MILKIMMRLKILLLSCIFTNGVLLSSLSFAQVVDQSAAAIAGVASTPSPSPVSNQAAQAIPAPVTNLNAPNVQAVPETESLPQPSEGDLEAVFNASPEMKGADISDTLEVENDPKSLETFNDLPGKPAGAYDGTKFGKSEEGQNPLPAFSDPSKESSHAYIVVTKNSNADSNAAIMVAAKRSADLGRYDAAIRFYEQVLQKSPDNLQARSGLAFAQYKSGYRQSALESYNLVLQKNETDIETLVNILGILREDYPAVALERGLHLLEKYPNHAGLNAQVGVAHASLKNYDEALSYLGSAASLDPNNPLYVYNMAVIIDQMGQKKQAVEYYDEALKINALHGNDATLPKEEIYNRLSVLR
jgi:Flp pilus assembly protein TadD